jgi:2-oxo-4-hydroxy-4-carboxy-5-ureidoimidazoline decarboxylase
MNSTLAEWNTVDHSAAIEAMIACCGSRRWAAEMVALRPIPGIAQLSTAADDIWRTMGESDLLEAFSCHPRIGERKQPQSSSLSAAWSRQEQSSANSASDSLLTEIDESNALYEQQFGFTYIVCATGKSAEEMLAILKRRLMNDRAAELKEAAEQQRQITQIRLGKWLTT